jgi:hypothetical protein
MLTFYINDDDIPVRCKYIVTKQIFDTIGTFCLVTGQERLPLNTLPIRVRVGVFNNISAISWRSVLLVEETGVPEENKPSTCRKYLTNFIT